MSNIVDHLVKHVQYQLAIYHFIMIFLLVVSYVIN